MIAIEAIIYSLIDDPYMILDQTVLQKKTLAEQITEVLTDHIQTKMMPGEELPSTEQIAQNFGVSRIVIREALKALEAQGIVTITSGKKTQVKPFNGDILGIYFHRALASQKGLFLELMEVRRAIETQGAVLACQRRTEEELEELRTIYLKMKKAVPDLDLYTLADVEFHIKMASASHNSVLFHMVSSIRKVLKNTIYTSLHEREGEREFKISLGYHKKAVEAIAEQDTDKAQKAMTDHFDDAIRFFSKFKGKQG